MRLISQDGTFDVPYDQVVIQRYSDGIYWLNKNLIGIESGISEDFKIASYSSETKAIKVMEMVRGKYKNFTFTKKSFHISGFQKTKRCSNDFKMPW